MLNKAAAILLLCVFVWSHYVRQALYLECRLANSFKSYGVVCDCEKKAGLAQPGSQAPQLPPAHAHIHPDELFPVTYPFQPDLKLQLSISTNFPYRNEKDCRDWYGKPFRPPRGC